MKHFIFILLLLGLSFSTLYAQDQEDKHVKITNIVEAMHIMQQVDVVPLTIEEMFGEEGWELLRSDFEDHDGEIFYVIHFFVPRKQVSVLFYWTTYFGNPDDLFQCSVLGDVEAMREWKDYFGSKSAFYMHSDYDLLYDPALPFEEDDLEMFTVLEK